MTEAPGAGLLRIPPGRVRLRDARTDVTRTIDVVAFEFAATTVTVDAWRSGEVRPPRPGERPVAGVTWIEAVRWCNAASVRAGLTPAYREADGWVDWDPSGDGFRLPTEAEWMRAAAADAEGPHAGELGDTAWTAADDCTGPQPVASRAPNDFGVFDALGNVWEWCWDFADPARYGDYRSLRGGGWADPPWSVRLGVRRGSAPDARLEDVGVRVARGSVGAANARAAQGWDDAADRRRADVRGFRPVGWTPLRFPSDA